MRIIITGPTGSIGSEMVRIALDRGFDVVAITHPGSKRNSHIDSRAEILECDISDYRDLDVKGQSDIFFHLAWQGTTGASRNDEVLQRSNIQYSLDAVELAKKSGCSCFVGVGSQAEYGPQNAVLNEQTPLNPVNAYGIAKLTAGDVTRERCAQLGMRHEWARVLSVYGTEDPEGSLVRYVITSLLNKEVPQLTRCEQKWDYIYAKDCARAILMIGSDGKDGRTYCVGSGQCRPLSEYVGIIRDRIDRDAEIGFGRKEYTPNQPMMLCADISELTKDTGFTPEYSFEEGISEVLAQMKRTSGH